jgi:hypothetical protein
VAGALDEDQHLAKSRGVRRRSNCRGSAATFPGTREGARGSGLFRLGLFPEGGFALHGRKTRGVIRRAWVVAGGDDKLRSRKEWRGDVGCRGAEYLGGVRWVRMAKGRDEFSDDAILGDGAGSAGRLSHVVCAVAA